MDNENSRGILPSGKTIASWFGVLLVIAVVLFGGFVTLFVNHVDQHEFGYMVERLKGGKLSTIAQKGYIVTPPFVTKLDTRPQRVCIASRARVMNCRLARVDANNYRALVAREGFRYYWWDNRLSVNFGYDEEYRGIRDLIRGYAFAEEKVEFVKSEKG